MRVAFLCLFLGAFAFHFFWELADWAEGDSTSSYLFCREELVPCYSFCSSKCNLFITDSPFRVSIISFFALVFFSKKSYSVLKSVFVCNYVIQVCFPMMPLPNGNKIKKQMGLSTVLLNFHVGPQAT